MIPLYKPFVSKNYRSILEALYSGDLASGEPCEKFEKEIRNKFKFTNFLSTISYSTAWLAFLDACNFSNGDEVIVSPMACVASLQPLTRYGLKIVWGDVDPKTGNFDFDYLQQIISERTRMIIINHFCGYVSDLNRIREICENYDILIVEDLIEGFGSEHQGCSLGSGMSDASIISFEPVRLLNTLQGGGIVLNENNLYERVIQARDNGVVRSNFRTADGEISSNSDVSVSGLGSKQNNVNATVGLENLKYFNENLARHRSNANILKLMLEKIPFDVEPLLYPENASNNYWVYGILVEEKQDFMEWIRKRGFAASGVHGRLDRYTVFSAWKKDLPGVTDFAEHFVAIPSGWWVNEQDFEKLL